MPKGEESDEESDDEDEDDDDDEEIERFFAKVFLVAKPNIVWRFLFALSIFRMSLFES